jgi:hypothetical protein
MSANSAAPSPRVHDPSPAPPVSAPPSEGGPKSPQVDGTAPAPPAPPADGSPAPAPAAASPRTRPRLKITDHDFPQDATLFLGDLEPWMDEHYLVQVCSLLGWDTVKMHIPRPPVAANATRHPNNSGYALLIMASPDTAQRVCFQFGPDGPPQSQPILLPNSNHPIKIDWADSPLAQTAIGKELGPVDNAIEYSIFVGDLAGDVTNADLMNVFRNPNLGLRGDFPPRLIAPFHSCCNAKVMVDSFSGVSKGYGFVRCVITLFRSIVLNRVATYSPRATRLFFSWPVACSSRSGAMFRCCCCATPSDAPLSPFLQQIHERG